MQKRRRCGPGTRWARVLCVAAIAVVIPASAAARNTASALPQLDVVIGAWTTGGSAAIEIAKYEGFFTKAGVDVNIHNDGTTNVTTFLAGRADAIIAGPTALFPGISQGKDSKVIWTMQYGNRFGFVVPFGSSAQTATDLAGGTVPTAGAGFSLGLGQALSNYIVSQGKPALNLTTAISPTGNFMSLVASNQVAAAAQDSAIAQPYLAANQVRYLKDLEPGSPLMLQMYPDTVVGASIIAATSTIADPAKKAALIKFVAGLRLANEWMDTHTAFEISAVLESTGANGFGGAGITLPQEVLSVNVTRPTWSIKQQGFVSAQAWTDSLKAWSGWNLTTGDDTQPQWNYGNRVDMTLYSAATPIVDALSRSLEGTVDAKGKLTLALDGHAVSKASAGKYIVTVSDKSKTTAFMLQQNGHAAKTITTASFVGTKRVTLTLGAGSWSFYATASGKKAKFTVS
jgi:ABC-type nitrate/sulfonate/bicarbonate transport system substrate-binding protein